MALETILTFDIGTSACKVCLWDACGTLLASSDEAYPIHHPQPDWAEQDPEDWWRASVAAAGRCLVGHDSTRVAVLGLSSQREGVVPMGPDGTPLARCIIWMDRRCQDQAARLAQEFGSSFLHHHTGLSPDPNYTACKLLWVREHQPDLIDRTATFLQPRDYLYYRLTGELVTDYTLASRTMMLDLRRHAWWPDIFRRIGVRQEQFPPIFRSTDAPHRLSAPAAPALGLPAGIPVSLGAGDRPCEAVGIEPGEVVAMGGGARSDLWVTIKADILALPVLRPRYTEAASIGAALVAARSVDLIDDLDATARKWNPIQETVAPDPEAARFYQGRRALYEDVYGALQPLFPRLHTP